MKVIGLIGMIGSGKDAVNDYIANKYGYKVVHMGDIVRTIAKERGLDTHRNNLDSIQKECTEKHGQGYFAQEVVREIKESGVEKAIINGIRRPVDAEVPKKIFGNNMILVQVDADPQVRFERLSKRGRPGDPKTIEEFERQERDQFKLFNLEKTLKRVDHKLENDGTLKELHDKIDKLLKKTGFN